MIHQIETLRAYIEQRHIPGGIAYSGHSVHFWIDKHHTYCGKSNLVRREDRLWEWKTNSICKGCMAEIERAFIDTLKDGER